MHMHAHMHAHVHSTTHTAYTSTHMLARAHTLASTRSLTRAHSVTHAHAHTKAHHTQSHTHTHTSQITHRITDDYTHITYHTHPVTKSAHARTRASRLTLADKASSDTRTPARPPALRHHLSPHPKQPPQATQPQPPSPPSHPRTRFPRCPHWLTRAGTTRARLLARLHGVGLGWAPGQSASDPWSEGALPGRTPPDSRRCAPSSPGRPTQPTTPLRAPSPSPSCRSRPGVPARRWAGGRTRPRCVRAAAGAERRGVEGGGRRRRR
jgi:hypothetical protein